MMKKIIYFSDSRFPLAGLAGAIHTGNLPLERDPTSREIWNQQFMNTRKTEEGKIIPLGKDEWENEIYALSVKGERGMPFRLVSSFLSMHKIPEDKLSLIDTGLRDNLFIAAGKILIKIKIFIPLGKYLTFLGVKKCYPTLSKLVFDIRSGLANLP